MFGKKEAEVKELFLSHIESVEKTLELLREAVRCYLRSEQKCARDIGFEVHKAESTADEFRRKIIQKLYSGAFLPMMREDLVRFIAHQDKIADRAESCCDFCMTQKPKVPEAFNEAIIKLLEASLDTFIPYKETLEKLMNTKSSYEEVREKIHSVNTSEELSDKEEWHLIDKIFSSDLPLAEKLHLREFVFHMVSISDVIEDAADDVDLLMVKQKV